jgi:hypothetical protein
VLADLSLSQIVDLNVVKFVAFELANTNISYAGTESCDTDARAILSMMNISTTSIILNFNKRISHLQRCKRVWTVSALSVEISIREKWLAQSVNANSLRKTRISKLRESNGMSPASNVSYVKKSWLKADSTNIKTKSIVDAIIINYTSLDAACAVSTWIRVI